MLQDLREKFTGWVALVILGLIAVTFVFVGVTPGFISSGFAAKVDGREIGVGYFEQSYRNQIQENPALAQAGDELRVQIRRAVLENLIRDQLIANYLDDAGFRISDQQVADAIQGIPEFQVDGVFDLSTYRETIAGQGWNTASYEAAQRQALRERQLQLAIRASSLVTPAEYRRYLNLVAEQRVVTVADLGQDAVRGEIEITDDAILAFYESNADRYRLPESADIEFIAIRRADIAANVAITEQRLAEFYEEQQFRYLQDEQRQSRHILILFGDDEAAAEARAREALARLNAGESFEALAAELSEDGATAPSGGDLGVLTRSQMIEELGSALFAMQEGDIDGPIKSDFGFHVVRLDRVFEQGPLPFDEVRGELLAELQEVEAEDAFRNMERQVSDALFDSEDIQAVSASTGLAVETASGITRADGGPFGTNQAVIDAVFFDDVLTGGRITEIVEVDAGTSAIFRVTNYVEPQLETLEAVRDRVEAALIAEEASALLAERAAQIIAAVEAGEDFAAVAEASGATVSDAKLVGRRDQSVDPSVVFEIFSAPKPEAGAPVVQSVPNTAGGYTVFSLAAVLPGRPETIPLEERDSGKELLGQQSGTGDYVAFIETLRAQANVVINEDAVAAEDLFQ